jgi:hypothetical protein
MIYTIQFIKKAREMRLAGASLSEISRETSVSKGTLSSWLKDISLNKAQQEAIIDRSKNRMSRGRLNSQITRKSKRIHRENSIYTQAEKEIVEYIKDPFFNYGLALYILGGSKNGNAVQFTSSNNQIIKVMIKWIERYLGVDSELIKQREYGSYRRIEISRIDVLRRVLSWQKLIIKYYDNL